VGLEHNPGSDKRSFDVVVGFFFLKDDPNDTSAGHRTDRELRKAQVEMRLAELEECTGLTTSTLPKPSARKCANMVRCAG
jgi:hypothetical protein